VKTPIRIAALPSYQPTLMEFRAIASSWSYSQPAFICAEDVLGALGPETLTKKSLADLVELSEALWDATAEIRAVLPAPAPESSNALRREREFTYVSEVVALLLAAVQCEGIVREGVHALGLLAPPLASTKRRRRRGRIRV